LLALAFSDYKAAGTTFSSIFSHAIFVSLFTYREGATQISTGVL
jgi:hypothetical protein